MKYISPSILSADFARLGEAIEMLNQSEAEWIHVDVMDGVFVPNISFGFPVMEPLKRLARKPLDVHLMITEPIRYVERFCDAGAWSVGFHLEAVDDPMPTLEKIRAKGVRTALTINPDIAPERLLPYLDKVDMVMLMSVFAGFGGQKFIPETLDKVRFIKQAIRERQRPQTSGSLSVFPDADYVSEWAWSAMCWAVENGIIHGSVGPEGVVLAPGSGATRAQTAAILRNHLTGQ